MLNNAKSRCSRSGQRAEADLLSLRTAASIAIITAGTDLFEGWVELNIGPDTWTFQALPIEHFYLLNRNLNAASIEKRIR